MQPTDLAHNIAVAATGADDGATAAYVHQVLLAHPQYAAVAAHWYACSEALQSALGSHLGWCEPTRERCPVPVGIRLAYEAVCTAGYEAVGEPD